MMSPGGLPSPPPRSAALDRRHDEDLRRRPVELADRRRPPRAVEPERQPPAREILGKGRLRRGDRLRPILIPLGQRQVAMAGLQQPQFRHDGALPSTPPRIVSYPAREGPVPS